MSIVLFTLFFLFVIFLPVLAAFKRNHPSKWAITALVFSVGFVFDFGVFFGLGWIVGLVWALSSKK